MEVAKAHQITLGICTLCCFVYKSYFNKNNLKKVANTGNSIKRWIKSNNFNNNHKMEQRWSWKLKSKTNKKERNELLQLHSMSYMGRSQT